MAFSTHPPQPAAPPPPPGPPHPIADRRLPGHVLDGRLRGPGCARHRVRVRQGAGACKRKFRVMLPGRAHGEARLLPAAPPPRPGDGRRGAGPDAGGVPGGPGAHAVAAASRACELRVADGQAAVCVRAVGGASGGDGVLARGLLAQGGHAGPEHVRGDLLARVRLADVVPGALPAPARPHGAELAPHPGPRPPHRGRVVVPHGGGGQGRRGGDQARDAAATTASASPRVLRAAALRPYHLPPPPSPDNPPTPALRSWSPRCR